MKLIPKHNLITHTVCCSLVRRALLLYPQKLVLVLADIDIHPFVSILVYFTCCELQMLVRIIFEQRVRHYFSSKEVRFTYLK